MVRAAESMDTHLSLVHADWDPFRDRNKNDTWIISRFYFQLYRSFRVNFRVAVAVYIPTHSGHESLLYGLPDSICWPWLCFLLSWLYVCGCLPTCMYLCILRVYPWRSKESVRPHRTGFRHHFEPPHGYWEVNLGPLQEQQVFLPTESSLQPFICFLGDDTISGWF